MRVIGRAEWGARFRDGFGGRSISAINSWWLHHSATGQLPVNATFDQDAGAIRSIESVGQSRFGGGVSYTYLIPPSGRIFQGHSLGRIGAHTQGYNTRGVGICLVGNYEVHQPTPQQLAAVVWLLQNVLGHNLTGGHRDTKGTACPGAKAYSRIPAIRDAFNGQAIHVDNPVDNPPAPVVWHLKNGSKGDDVLQLQQHLNRMYPSYSQLEEDGDFGPATERVVKEFQRRVFITVDGIVGPVTSEKLGIDWSATADAPRVPAPLGPPAGLIAPPFPLPAGHYFGWREGPNESVSGYFSHREDLRQWQQRMKDRGWAIDADGLYGDQTNNIARLFQAEKGLAVDGAIGPQTWEAAWTAPIT